MSRRLSLTDEKKGKWLVKEHRWNKDKRRSEWRCICECGTERYIPTSHLTLLRSKSCGCSASKSSSTRKWKGYESISSTYWTSCKHNAKLRGFEFSVEIEEAWDKYIKQDMLCALSGEPIAFGRGSRDTKNQTASLDRIDSSLGYTHENIQWVHKTVNKMKSDLRQSEFIEFSRKISDFRKIKRLEIKNNWDKRFLILARHISTYSKDPSTQVGAVIFDKNNRVISMGYNGFPVGIKDNERIFDRDTKLQLTIHAEMNAILFSHNNLDGSTIAVWPFPPCSSCSSCIIQSGISRVISVNNVPERWRESMEKSKALLREAGREIVLYEVEGIES